MSPERRVTPRPTTQVTDAKIRRLKTPMDVFSASERREIDNELDEQARARRRAEADASNLRLG